MALDELRGLLGELRDLLGDPGSADHALIPSPPAKPDDSPQWQKDFSRDHEGQPFDYAKAGRSHPYYAANRALVLRWKGGLDDDARAAEEAARLKVEHARMAKIQELRAAEAAEEKKQQAEEAERKLAAQEPKTWAEKVRRV